MRMVARILEELGPLATPALPAQKSRVRSARYLVLHSFHL